MEYTAGACTGHEGFDAGGGNPCSIFVDAEVAPSGFVGDIWGESLVQSRVTLMGPWPLSRVGPLATVITRVLDEIDSGGSDGSTPDGVQAQNAAWDTAYPSQTKVTRVAEWDAILAIGDLSYDWTTLDADWPADPVEQGPNYLRVLERYWQHLATIEDTSLYGEA